MSSNSDDDTQSDTDKTDDRPGTETDQAPERDDETPPVGLTRRNALVGAGLGLGLLNGLRNGQPGPRERPWNQDVDANEHELRTLGGLNMASMDEEELLTDFEGPNLELDGTSLRIRDLLDVETVTLSELRGSLTGGEPLTDLVGEGLLLDDGRLDVTANWRRRDTLLEPSDEDVEGIEVEEVQSPEEETLDVTSDSDLHISLSGEGGTVRIETPGGHEVVLDDGGESESVAIEDSAGNSIEMDADAETVSIAANQKIELEAPTIELSASANLDVESEGIANLTSRGLVDIDGALIRIGPGGKPAASVGDTVAEGLIQTGSAIVLL